MNNTVFLFGAGAESVFKMPLGPQYTVDTILSKRSNMYKALDAFYKNRIPLDFCDNYKKEFLFNKNSHTFFEIIYRASEKCSKNEQIDKQSKEVIDAFSQSKKLSSNKPLKKVISDKVYDYVIIDLDNDKICKNTRKHTIDKTIEYHDLIQSFTYYGTIEKDFSTIINPKESGTKRFWRIINYFWSAYFSIIIPVLELSEKFRNDQEFTNDKYSYILNNLVAITEYIYSYDFFHEYKDDTKIKENYYSLLSRNFTASKVITTNYTPFLRNYWDIEDIAYLAGQLSLFEKPNKLEIVTAAEINKNDFIFPYLSTQAPIKPIIDASQLCEYHKCIEFLKKVSTLIIIGYNINENDNHINSLLHNYITMKKENKIIYFQYSKKTNLFDEKAIWESVCRRLKLNNTNHKNQIIVRKNDGNTIELLNTLYREL